MRDTKRPHSLQKGGGLRVRQWLRCIYTSLGCVVRTQTVDYYSWSYYVMGQPLNLVPHICTTTVYDYCMLIRKKTENPHYLYGNILTVLTPIHICSRSVGIQSKQERGSSSRSFPWKHMGRVVRSVMTLKLWSSCNFHVGTCTHAETGVTC